MYTFELTDTFLSEKEKDIFKGSLDHFYIDENIWNVFSCLFRSSTKNTSPLLLKVYEDSELCGAAVIIKCKTYGRSLFKNKFLAGIIDFLKIPFYLWIKFGCCMDMMSNPGFIRNLEKSEEIYRAMIKFLKDKTILTIINDYTINSHLYPEAAILPALPHALIDTSEFTNVQDYIRVHKNIKRKMNIFCSNGGTFDVISKIMNENEVASVEECFISTAEKSVLYLPYQDLYLNSALNTSSTELENVYYFVARLNGNFIGYQAALVTGSCLNALHGAFDRNRETTFHAYDILFARMTQFAIEKRLKTIDFGSVINVTKQRMVNKIIDMSYFLLSKYSFIELLFCKLLKLSRIQGKEQMKFLQQNKNDK